jgi:hypothetical protein
MKASELTPQILRLMSPADKELYGGTAVPVAEASAKTGKLERHEQRDFASWSMLHNYAIVWHSTAHRSKASIGCPDFLLTVNGYTLAIEFKQPGARLSAGQEDWRARHVANGGIYHIVTSAAQAISLCEKYACLPPPPMVTL